MLQQTQVSRVIDKYRQFMRRFPTVEILAAASEHDVLAMWQGLGYYRRARNLHAASKMIVDRFGGRIPADVKELRQLPGVGRYTAGALASIVFDQPEPIVDGNVQRVLMRVFASESRRWRKDPVPWTWGKAQALVQAAGQPASFNEGLMELGATICLPAPAAPQCGKCPLKAMCDARRLGIQEQVPPPKRLKKPREVHHHSVILQRPRSRRIFIEQRPATGMWSNMWQVPTIEAELKLSAGEVARRVRGTIDDLKKLGQFAHQTTHRRITFHVYAGKSSSARRKGEWIDPAELHSWPISNAQKRVLKSLASR
jgi:A/G-specific adenine glycosylase